MTHLRLLERALLAASVALSMVPATTPATAETLGLSFTGEIVYVEPSLLPLGTGEPVSGSILYDTTPPDVDPDPTHGIYPGAVRAVTLQFGTYTVTGAGGGFDVSSYALFGFNPRRSRCERATRSAWRRPRRCEECGQSPVQGEDPRPEGGYP